MFQNNKLLSINNDLLLKNSKIISQNKEFLSKYNNLLSSLFQNNNFLSQNKENLEFHCKALELLLDDNIFEMINFVDSMKLFIGYYGFGYSRNLLLDFDITPKTFCEQNPVELLIRENRREEGNNEFNDKDIYIYWDF